MPFVFRAAAALDVRRRRHDTEQRARSLAAAAVERAERSVSESVRSLERAMSDAASVPDPTFIEWHRNWILSRRLEIGKQEQRLGARREELADADARALVARRELRALERLRERALTAHRQLEAREEQKALDWLGTVRHALRTYEERQEDV